MRKLYCIPKPEQLDQFVAFSKEYDAAFEYNDFFLPIVLDQPNQVENLIKQYTSLDRDRSMDTLHGVFLDICVNSDDPEIYKISNQRVHQSMDIGKRLGVSAVIFHTNHIPNFRLKSYREGWLRRNQKYWTELLHEYPDMNIYLENMFDDEPDLLCRLAEAMQDEPRFGVCYDVAHAFISCTPLKEWNQSLLPFTRHLHINDNHKTEDTHNPVGSASLPWQQYQDFVGSISEEQKPSVLIEVRSYEELMESVRYMEEHKLYPFENI